MENQSIIESFCFIVDNEFIDSSFSKIKKNKKGVSNCFTNINAIVCDSRNHGKLKNRLYNDLLAIDGDILETKFHSSNIDKSADICIGVAGGFISQENLFGENGEYYNNVILFLKDFFSNKGRFPCLLLIELKLGVSIGKCSSVTPEILLAKQKSTESLFRSILEDEKIFPYMFVVCPDNCFQVLMSRLFRYMPELNNKTKFRQIVLIDFSFFKKFLIGKK